MQKDRCGAVVGVGLEDELRPVSGRVAPFEMLLERARTGSARCLGCHSIEISRPGLRVGSDQHVERRQHDMVGASCGRRQHARVPELSRAPAIARLADRGANLIGRQVTQSHLHAILAPNLVDPHPGFLQALHQGKQLEIGTAFLGDGDRHGAHRRAPTGKSYVDQHTKNDFDIGLIGGQEGMYSSSAEPICFTNDRISDSCRSCSAMTDI